MLQMLTCLLFAFAGVATGKVVDFEQAGAVPDDDSLATAVKNGGIFNTSLLSLAEGDTLLFPNKTFHLMGGIKVRIVAYMMLGRVVLIS